MLNRILFLPILALLLIPIGFAHADPSDATLATFKRLDDYMQNNPLEFETTFAASSDGDELYSGKGHFILSQPNSVRADITLDKTTFLIVSDGTVLTIENTEQKKYSENQALASLSATFGFFTGELGIDSQVINFIDVVHQVVAGGSGMTVKSEGAESVDGKMCDKFLVTSASGDDTWQAWLEQGDKPLLRKLVYHSVDGPAQNTTLNWSTAANITPETFKFTPPPGSTRADIGDLNMVSP